MTPLPLVTQGNLDGRMASEIATFARRSPTSQGPGKGWPTSLPMGRGRAWGRRARDYGQRGVPVLLFFWAAEGAEERRKDANGNNYLVCHFSGQAVPSRCAHRDCFRNSDEEIFGYNFLYTCSILCWGNKPVSDQERARLPEVRYDDG
jgi:hypothetical protein